MSGMMIYTMFAIDKYDAHYRSSNFEKVKMCKANRKFEKFESTVNLLYTGCAMSKMMTSTIFSIVNMMRITGVVISKKSKCAEQRAISKR